MIRSFCLWLMLGTLVTCARGDCDACVAGRCHSRKTLMQGFHVTDQLAVDRTSNIIYAQLNHNLNTAIFLDEPKTRLVHTMNTTGMAVNQMTRVLYAGVGNIIHGIKYEEDGYTTETAYMLDDFTATARLHFADTLYTINTDGSCAYFRTATGESAGEDNLEDFEVTDMVKVINTTTWVFVADNNVYKFVWDNGDESSHLISKNKDLLSTDKYGDVYIRDASKKIIYKLDRITEELVEYASYETGSVEDFVFEKDNNIVFRDADGTIARWVPEQELCYGIQRADLHYVVDFASSDNYLIKLLRHPEDFYSTIPPTEYDY